MSSCKPYNEIKKYKNSNKSNKKIIENTKILVKNYNFNQIYNDFFNWLSGIQEDEPMPLEVKYVYFIVEFFQNDIVISYSGDENELQVFDYGFYSPLEGQYFDCAQLKIIAKDVFIKKSISQNKVYALIKDMVFNVAPKLWFIEDKQILCGIKHKQILL